MQIKANLILPSVNSFIKEIGFNEGGRTQQYVDNFIINESKPYLPGNRHLFQSSKLSSKIGSGLIIYDTPDSNYLYEGKVMVDPKYKVAAFPIRNGKISFKEEDGEIEGFVSRRGIQKIMDPKNRDLHYHGNSLQGSLWFDRMIEDKMDELLKGINNIIDGE